MGFYKKPTVLKPTKDFLNAFVAVQKEAGQFEGALATLTDYATKNPSDIEAQYAIIEVHTQMGNMDGLCYCIEILLSESTNITVYQLLSEPLSNNQSDMSLLCAEKANEMLMSVAKEKGQLKKDAGILNNMGVTFLAMEDEPSAIGYFQEAIGIEPNHVEANLNLGFIALNSGNYQFALEKFDAALITNANHMSAKLGRAVALRGTQDFDGASKLYAQILIHLSRSYCILQRLFCSSIKRTIKSSTTLEEYKSLNPADSEVDERLAELSTLQAEEAARKKEEERRKAEEERKKRQQEKMNESSNGCSISTPSKDALGSCTECY